MYQSIIGVLVTSDTDPKVRETAYLLAGSIRTPNETIKTAVAQAAVDLTRSESERKTAKQTVSKIQLNQDVPKGIYYLSSSSPSEPAVAQSPFTKLIIDGMSGAADMASDGQVSFQDLAHYVTARMVELVNGVQHPMWVVDDASPKQPLLFGKGVNYDKMVALIAANAKYDNPKLPSVPGIDEDARRFEAFIRSKGGTTVSLMNGTSSDFLSHVSGLATKLSSNSLLIVYYSGSSPGDKEDKAAFYFRDGSTLSAAEFMDPIRNIPAKTRVVFVDGCFAAGAPRPKL